MLLSHCARSVVKERRVKRGQGIVEHFFSVNTALATLRAEAQRAADIAIIGHAIRHSGANLRVGDAFAQTDIHSRKFVELSTYAKSSANDNCCQLRLMIGMVLISGWRLLKAQVVDSFAL